MNERLTEYLLKQSSKLPTPQLREVIDFTEFLLSKTSPPVATATTSQNSLNRFLGGITHGSLAGNIDNDLYGSTFR